jgi:hypothetical protein
MILHALFSACFAYFMIDVLQWQKWPLYFQVLETPLFARKPFSCITCLSAWTGLTTGLLNGYGWQSVEVMIIAGVMGLVMNQAINKYL